MFKQFTSASAFVMAATLLAAAPACAAQRPYYAQRDFRDFERRAHDDGYRRGVENGERDARERLDFRIDRDRVFRDARYGDNDEYRRIFRDGYRDGYTEGYNRFARQRYSAPGRNFISFAAQIGYRDGVDIGRNDANDRQNYDPRRSRRFRDGDHNFDNRYGSRDQFRREYRDAFLQGYEEGYRGFRR